MTRNKLFALLAAVTLGITTDALAQDPAFTQFYANPMYLNPAMAGSANCPRVSLNHRNQWPNLRGSFITNSISIDRNVESLNGGLGLQIVNDVQGEGVIKGTQVNAIYSYQLQVSRKITVLTGIQASYHQKTLDKSKLFFGDQIDPNYGFIYETQENPDLIADNVGYSDISLGMMAFTKKYFFGLALHHITQPDDSYIAKSFLPSRFTIHTGANIAVGRSKRMGIAMDGPFITPNLMYLKQAGAEQLNLGLSLTNESLSGGLYYRSNFSNPDAILAVVGVERNGIRIGYSYDYTVSKLSGASGGSHEISVTIQLACRKRRKKLKAIKCPKF